VEFIRRSYPVHFQPKGHQKYGESIDRLQRTFSSRLFNLARLAGSFLPFTGIEPIITRKTARQKKSASVIVRFGVPGAQPQTSD
jgi:hypothetical protein